jgi:menaquinol-cytochrome c reductase iron-sulfur subunit
MSEKTGTGDCTRRQFFMHVSIALGSIAAVLVGIPIVGSILAPIIKKPKPEWRAVGAVDGFKIGGGYVKVDYVDASPLPWAGVTAQSAAWLRRESEDKFIAFSVNCAHLGCPVRWVAGAKLFMCPCHGGVYYEDGSVAAGPPPRGLYQYPVRVVNGQVEILASPIPITTV